ncbi:hypothetical protein [Planctomonas psychrotolerans]|uniref:hypothetical protein n=1 Tax=Planctomonas psychrotolerans TaxID=2528712 RepID=UPI00123A0BDE|nr:hypothetical protein [Planctomonas psychrotolerans]
MDPDSDGTLPSRASDVDRLGELGSPIFTLVDQLRVQERSFSFFGFSNKVARLHFWLADASGNFWFEDTPIGPMGVAELKGFVFTDVLGVLDDGDREYHELVPDSAVRHYLADALDYYSADPLEDLASGKSEFHRGEIAERHVTDDTLVVDGAPHPATSLDYGAFRAISGWVGDRLATLVVRPKDLAFLDARLVTRPRTSHGR